MEDTQSLLSWFLPTSEEIRASLHWSRDIPAAQEGLFVVSMVTLKDRLGLNVSRKKNRLLVLVAAQSNLSFSIQIKWEHTKLTDWVNDKSIKKYWFVSFNQLFQKPFYLLLLFSSNLSGVDLLHVIASFVSAFWCKRKRYNYRFLLLNFKIFTEQCQ